MDLEKINIYTDETRYLIYKIVEQAIRDYLSLYNAKTLADKFDYQTAVSFLFDDNYTINWADEEKNLEDLLDIINIDISWIRYKVVKLKNQQVIDIYNERFKNK